MNDQLLCGIALSAVAVAAAVASVPWLATAALIAALPFLAVGALLALGGFRTGHDHPASSTH